MVTLGFVSHHVEALPFIRQQMENHRVLVLEEPSSPQFTAMLDGDLSMEDYLMGLDSEFPEFDRHLCLLLQELHAQGRCIVQIEPYLEMLIQIHELFAAGKTPDDVLRSLRLEPIYTAEKRATAALITYYGFSTQAPFDNVVAAVKTFARADAVRLTLRERLRAQSIASFVKASDSVFIEAGYIHYPLYRYLLEELEPACRVRVLFLLQPVYSKLNAKRRNLGPGDILTLHYALHGNLRRPAADLLAARSLIYIKLIQKQELLPGPSPAPHAEDEARVNRIVDRLGYDDCRVLFNAIRLLKREHALQIVTSHLAGGSSRHGD